MSERGDVLIFRELRGELQKETPESFFRHIKLSESESDPIFNVDGINYFYIRQNFIYIVFTSRFDVSPSMVMTILEQFI